MNAIANSHQAVLLTEAIDALVTDASGVYLDLTFGRGGHSREILARLSETGRLYAVDRDPTAEVEAKKIDDARFQFVRGAFSDFDEQIGAFFANDGENKYSPLAQNVDGILMDLGVSSPQLDNAERGFSFRHDAELDMRMDPNTKLTAKEFVNTADYGELVNVIVRFGDERFAKKIAKHIIKQREIEPICTTTQLADIVSSAIPARFHVPGRNPATRTFQAVRIHVNDELGELERALPKAYDALKSKGRLVVIAFHSGEDALVRDFVKGKSGNELPPEIPVPDADAFRKMRLIGRPVRPSEKEVADNPRSECSLMRIVEKV